MEKRTISGERANSRGHLSLGERRKHDARILALYDAGETGAAIAEAVGVAEDRVWWVVRQSGHRRQAGSQGVAHKGHKSDWNVRRVDGAVDRYHVPVTMDEAALPSGCMGYIVYIGDTPGIACETPEAAVRSAVAHREGT